MSSSRLSRRLLRQLRRLTCCPSRNQNKNQKPAMHTLRCRCRDWRRFRKEGTIAPTITTTTTDSSSRRWLWCKTHWWVEFCSVGTVSIGPCWPHHSSTEELDCLRPKLQPSFPLHRLRLLFRPCCWDSSSTALVPVHVPLWHTSRLHWVSNLWHTPLRTTNGTCWDSVSSQREVQAFKHQLYMYPIYMDRSGTRS